MSRIRQYRQTLAPYAGLAESVITSATMFLGDAAMITGSWTTSSATASRLTLVGYEGSDHLTGFTSSLPGPVADGWNVIKVQTATGYFSLDTLPSWGRFLRNPSASSATLYVSIHVGG